MLRPTFYLQNMINCSALCIQSVVKSIYLNEVIGGSLRVTGLISSYFGLGLAGLLTNVQSIWFSDYKDYFWVQLGAISINIIGVFFMVETPFFYYNKRRVEDLFESLKKIAIINHCGGEAKRVVFKIREILKMDLYYQLKNNQFELFEESPSDLRKSESTSLANTEPQLQKTFKQEISDPKVILRLFRIMSLFVATYLVYGIAQFMNKDLGLDNIYLNGCLITIVEMGGYAICLLVIKSWGRRKIILLSNYIIAALVVTLITVDLTSKSFVLYQDRIFAVRVLETGSCFLLFLKLSNYQNIILSNDNMIFILIIKLVSTGKSTTYNLQFTIFNLQSTPYIHLDIPHILITDIYT